MLATSPASQPPKIDTPPMRDTVVTCTLWDPREATSPVKRAWRCHQRRMRYPIAVDTAKDRMNSLNKTLSFSPEWHRFAIPGRHSREWHGYRLSHRNHAQRALNISNRREGGLSALLMFRVAGEGLTNEKANTGSG